MGYKPGDFFLGIVDFLAVLVPGAVLIFALTPYAELVFGPNLLFPSITAPAIRWTAFAVVSYVAGHLIASVASSLLDPLYDRTYRNFHRLPERRSEDGVYAKLDDFFAKVHAAWNLKGEQASDPLLSAARQLRSRQLGTLPTEDSRRLAEYNMLMWAQSYVALRSSAAAAEIERYQANSKFFRSMAVVFFILAALTVFREPRPWSLSGHAQILLVVLVLFCYRFMQLR